MITLVAGHHVIVRESAVRTRQVDISDLLGDPLEFDGALLLFGPYTSFEPAFEALEGAGFVYWDEFFSVPHDGGTVPEWCSVSLSYRKVADE